MNKRYSLIPLLLAALSLTALADETQGSAQVQVQKVEASTGLRGLLDQAWAALRRYGPQLAARDANKNVTLVAGVRGAESTTSALKPYWKGDKTGDPAYIEQVKAFNNAQALADKGDFRQAAAAFSGFLQTYGSSNLKPNAQFALALSYSAGGEAPKAAAALKVFMQDYPQHPLRAEAERLLKEMGRS